LGATYPGCCLGLSVTTLAYLVIDMSASRR
jgi:hypothetical protein